MHVVFEANNPIEAHLVKHALEDAGLMVFVLGEHLFGAVGELPAGGFVRVCVPEQQVAQAEAVLRELPMVAGEALEDELDAPLDGSDSLGLA